ncbi:N-acetyltransferase family protein [Poriferisphaera sp. WC338]|uniref:GNAT family N-acetyltransferase n=1 Tax=Poriferisphaera sp. WC338 TaxID=3425129 RepID=UPI003D81A5BA
MPTASRYPEQYTCLKHLHDDEKVEFRVIRPDDESLMVKFHHMLSPLSVRRRYFDSLSLEARIDHDRLTRICDPNLENEIAIVADHFDKETDGHDIVAVGRLEDTTDGTSAEFAIVIADAWQRKGLGKILMRQLIILAQKKGLASIHAELMPENKSMRMLLRSLQFKITDDYEDHTTYASLII